MANRERGEVEFQADGKLYTARYSANALCSLEDELDQGIVEIVGEMQAWVQAPDRVRLTFLRRVFCAGLRDHHPEITLDAAGNLITSIGGVLGAFNIVVDALTAAFPTEEDAPPAPRKARPTKARAGSGARN